MSEPCFDRGVVWLRRDLRLHDHYALSVATERCLQVALVFCFDSNLLSKFSNDCDRRLTFIYKSLLELKTRLKDHGSDLWVVHGDPTVEIPRFFSAIQADALFVNDDYELGAQIRDRQVASQVGKDRFFCFKDHTIFSKGDILTKNSSFYKVFTPFKNECLKKLKNIHLAEKNVNFSRMMKPATAKLTTVWPQLSDLGYKAQDLWLNPGEHAGLDRLSHFAKVVASYKSLRDFPAAQGTSGLSVHLRFGTVSIRHVFRLAMSSSSEGSQTWLAELLWREFYIYLVSHVPELSHGHSFIKAYDDITWENSHHFFERWAHGQTGFPIVDAAMRHFNRTGWMHNRLRMIVASFLVKDLLVDWRKGEEYFAQNLLDYEFASNNGGWQWCASTGCDAQPYFRIFNPIEQAKKFDPRGEFILSECPEYKKGPLKNVFLPQQNAIVDHKTQRLKALALFTSRRQESGSQRR